MVDVRVICAIGKLGQLGLNGRLPWEGNPESEYKADVRRFFALTRGHVVIAGPRTIASFPDWARSDRSNTVQPSCFCESIKAAQATSWASSELKACSSPSCGFSGVNRFFGGAASHTAHATARHGRSFLLRMSGDRRLDGDDQTRDRRGVLEGRADNLGRIASFTCQ
jgi:hypothetical protein